MPLRPGEKIGSYEVVRRIGGGGTAEVFEVRHTVLGTPHALKVLLPQWVENAQVRSRFLQEGRIQSRIEHPGIVRVTDTVAEPGVAGLIMELLDGEALRDRLDRDGRIAPKEAVGWTLAALEAIAAAHAHGITHRDLKPENLFLQKHGSGERIRVLDFGIAKGPEAAHQTSQRGALGTCAYMSPEQVKDPSSVDARTDVFAMGAVLWELLVGRPAFEGSTPFDSMQKVLNVDPGPPSAFRSEVPHWLDDAVRAALAKNASDRFPTAEAFVAALRAGARGVELPGPARAPARSESRAWGVGAVFLVALGSLFVLALGGIALIAVVAVLFQPPSIQPLQATSDPCGNLTVTVDAKGRGQTLELFADGAPLTSWPLSGRQTFTHTAPFPMGSTVQLEAKAGVSAVFDTHVVNGVPAALVFQTPGSARAGAVGRTLVRVEGTCLPAGLTWEATVDGQTTQGPLAASQEFWLDTQALGEGQHLLQARLIEAGDGRTLTTGSSTLRVGEAPPPGDLDMDGHLSRSAGGDDCNDGDPQVNPTMSEASSPNGIDDDCDGRIDEGTPAYDDDGDGLAELQGDCDDGDATIRPGADELPDCRDQDCDGTVDEGVQLPQREDLYEPNDSQAQAFDLKTSTKRSFSTDLQLVASSTADEGWFEFYSQDGDFDDWGIDVTVTRVPANSTIRLEVYDASGSTRGSTLAMRDGDQLLVRGKALRDDSGNYQLRVVPSALHSAWCPVHLTVTAR
jgi:hypothetical protein